jgi:hypothetical protein
MPAQCEAFVRDKGVLPMLDNYSVAKQVLINMIVFTYLPAKILAILRWFFGARWHECEQWRCSLQRLWMRIKTL